MKRICKNCYWKVNHIGLRSNWCLTSKDLHNIKLNDTCKKFLSKKEGEKCGKFMLR